MKFLTVFVLFVYISVSYCHFNLNDVIRKGSSNIVKDLDHVKDVSINGNLNHQIRKEGSKVVKDLEHVKDVSVHVIGDLNDEVTKEGSKILKDLEHVSIKGNGCDCVYQKYDCGCCADIKIETLGVDDTGCVNITYLPDQYGVSLTFSWDDKVVINETVSARNPPPLCVGIPHVKLLDLCVALYDLDINNKTFHGCAKVEADVAHVEIEDIDLGCFNIPFSKKKALQHITDNDILKQKAAIRAIKSSHDLKRLHLSLN